MPRGTANAGPRLSLSANAQQFVRNTSAYLLHIALHTASHSPNTIQSLPGVRPLGTASVFVSQPIHTSRHNSILQRVTALLSGWFRSPTQDEDAGHLSAALRRDIGLGPKDYSPQPFAGWQP